jgi:hypothetical protein
MPRGDAGPHTVAVDPLDEDVRLAVYRAFADTGGPSSIPDLAADMGAAVEDVRASLRRLADTRHVVLGSSHEVVMAHPFAAVPLGFSVMGSRTLWWGGCAWDAFAIPHLVPDEPEALVATRCPGCGAPHAWVVDRQAPPPGEQVAHFLVPAAHMWDDILHTCGHQRLFCSERCVGDWLQRTGNERGYVMDVPTLWRLARSWYDGRLDRGYARRDPPSAASYFREVGLSGEFWGL